MRVYGLDFTSSPKKGKPLTLAICTLDGDSLCVEAFYELGGKATSPLEEYGAWLRGEGRWKGEHTWVAGLDFPFGMPLAAVCRFGWGRDTVETSWEGYIRQVYKMHGSSVSFAAAIKEWVYPNQVSEAGNPIKVQFKRLTDQVAHSHSPMKVSDNPYPGAMFYQGCRALLKAGIRVPPLRNSGCQDKIAVEAYPRLVAQRFFPAQHAFAELVATKKAAVEERKATPKEDAETRKALRARITELSAKAKLSLRYKEAGNDPIAAGNRSLILEGLAESDNPFGIRLSFSDPAQREACVRDRKADRLDSVLCAVQAAWAYGLRGSGFGVPTFDENGLLVRQVALEGWIVDPALLGELGH
jgi:hypothetical protein